MGVVAPFLVGPYRPEPPDPPRPLRVPLGPSVGGIPLCNFWPGRR